MCSGFLADFGLLFGSLGGRNSGPVSQVFNAIRQNIRTVAEAGNCAQSQPRGRGMHKNLCHIRVRTPEQTQPVPAEPKRHPRFNEFKNVFTSVDHNELNKFLNDHKHVQDDNELYNLAIAKFLK